MTKYDNKTIAKFVNYIMLNGKKSLALSILNDTFKEIRSKGQKNSEGIFYKAVENVVPKIEVRPKEYEDLYIKFLKR